MSRLSSANVLASLEAAAKDADEQAEAMVKSIEERDGGTGTLDAQLLYKYRDLRRSFHRRELKRGGFGP